jgi:hypothetical protein
VVYSIFSAPVITHAKPTVADTVTHAVTLCFGGPLIGVGLGAVASYVSGRRDAPLRSDVDDLVLRTRASPGMTVDAPPCLYDYVTSRTVVAIGPLTGCVVVSSSGSS